MDHIDLDQIKPDIFTSSEIWPIARSEEDDKWEQVNNGPNLRWCVYVRYNPNNGPNRGLESVADFTTEADAQSYMNLLELYIKTISFDEFMVATYLTPRPPTT